MSQPIIICYVPALHEGYRRFFEKYPDSDLYLIGDTLLAELPRLDRDIRALDAEVVRTSLIALYPQRNISVLQKDDLTTLPHGVEIVMPDEDISHTVAQQEALEHVTFVDVFLRWDRKISTTEFEVVPHRIVSEEEFDREMIAQASEQAMKSPDWWRQVGAVVITADGAHLSAHNAPLPSHDYTINTFGDPRSNFDAGEFIELSKVIHAEANIIAGAAKDGVSLDGAKLYVTTFPCPNCAKLVARSGIKEVYYRDGYSLLDAEDILSAFDVSLTLVKS